MKKRILRALVGGDEPRRPKRSLPSYDEPTPETHRRLSREEEAELALQRTAFNTGTPALLISLFLLTISAVPAIQLYCELRAPHRSGWLPMFDVLKTLPSLAKLQNVHSLVDFEQLLPHSGEIKAAEKALETDSVVSQWLLPPVQSILTGKLRAGNEQVYLGRDGWLFYRPDVDYVTGPPFLAPAQLRHRVHATRVQPDPVKAIVQFRDQLTARGIDLVILPVPVKPSIEGEMLSGRAQHSVALQNASFAEFQSRLVNAGVRVFDPAPLLMGPGVSSEPRYLESDTHWRPETMALVAKELAASLKLSAPNESLPLQVANQEITGTGDIARMLKLPEDQQIYRPQKVTIEQVTAGNSLWRSNPAADVLLLGDSFANIFSLETLGWGESAGFAEHLSVALGGRPIDCILRNSDGAFATREMLSRELARGRDRLAGKKVVIWEFAARELAFGDWKLLPMEVGAAAETRFFALGLGQEVEVSATIAAVSSVPAPGRVPYRDHVMAVHLTYIAEKPGEAPRQAIVYLQSMHDNVWTSAARFRPGDKVTLRLRPWADVSAQYEQINRSEIDDPALQLEEPVWGEVVK